MIKFIMRRTIYKEFDHDSQEMLLKLTAKHHIIELLCFMVWAVIWFFTFIPVFIIDICEDVELSITTQVAVSVFMVVSVIGLFVCLKVFRRAMFGFSQLLAEKIFFLVCTTKGKALCKNDFKTIRRVNEKLSMFVETQMCRGYCYSICFEMCKALKNGSIEFLAVKKFFPHDEEDDDGKDFTMHVLYVNNGWAFDTYSSRQYPIEQLHQIYKAKVYKTFSFDEISNKSYEEFREEQEPELAKWSNDNDCSMFWKGDKEST